MKTTDISTIEDLKKYVSGLAETLKGGEIIGLIGELGVGKTTFTQALADELGVEDEVRSPTFVIMQIYETGKRARRQGVQKLCHADAYRLEDGSELYGVGFDEYAGKEGVVTVLEWADRVPTVHKMKGFRELTLEFNEDTGRVIKEG